MRKLLVLGAILVTMAMAAQAMADPGTLLQRAGYSLAGGNFDQAIIETKEALEEMYQQSPLTLKNVTWLREAPQGYGIYSPRSSEVFDAAEPLLLYMEPVGYNIKKSGAYYKFGFSADLKVTALKGAFQGGLKKFAEEHVDSRSLKTEYFLFYTFNFRELPAGKYKLELIVFDENSSKQAVAELAFEKK